VSESQTGTQGEAEVEAYLASLRTRFYNAQIRKAKRPRGQYKKYLDLLRGNHAIAFIELPLDLFGNASVNSCQMSFDQNAEKMELDVRSYSVYEHIDKSRLLVNWNHPQVEEQFNAWVLKNTPMPTSKIASKTSEADTVTKDKVPVTA
jgi:hypothetical protein